MSTPDQIFDLILRVAEEAGKSPSQLARECEISPQRLFNWRHRGVPVAQVRPLAKALSGAILPHELRPDLPEIFPAPESIDVVKAA
ncbi:MULTISPECIES: YdaS family helix-turn-helix protein [Pseudomonas syringae group]|uniref:YdaS family helix-turn-helix protein n=1 Tax=Pseudomonas syringae group TaxID=136849 RepID=UPI0002089B45|nr:MULTISPECIES: YdaS family helix-turn-helix protein [Pseudomonas syringae group]MCQ3017992.1 helix-turn-helix domain-containing protein [Pseudomonas tremae]QGL58898.1 hypothetical protein POR16_22465 [Pseudomonas coronafaciens pv. oryzae str. 1_6]